MNSEQTYFFVGIKGTGMSSLALILHDKGYKVLGSDIDKYTFTQRGLENAGIKILPFDEDNIKEDMIVVAGNAFGDDQVEIKKAHEMGLTVQTYPETVEQIIEETTSIGVAGAHGKTSTSGLLAHVLSGVSPTSYLVGDGSGKGTPNARFFVFEADEYRRHFVAYHPDYAIMTNIDFDHPDYFTDIDDVRDAFETLAMQTKKGIFVWGEDENLRKLNAKVPVHYYGTKSDDDFRAENIKRTTKGSNFDVYFHDEFIGNYDIPMFGEHNVLNSLAVIAVSYMEKVDQQEIAKELLTFKGVKRRFTEKRVADMVIIDDYAHHPTEIRATLTAAQKYPHKRLVLVFQPHTYSRTKAFLDDFAEVLSMADVIVLADIFAAREQNTFGVSSKDILERLTAKGKDAHYFPSFEEIEKFLLKNCMNGDLLITMGAGNVVEIGESLLGK